MRSLIAQGTCEGNERQQRQRGERGRGDKAGAEASARARAGAGSSAPEAPPDATGHDYYYADCCRLDKDGNVPSGAVGPVSLEILPSSRETFYIHHEDESFKHVAFDELVAAYHRSQ